MTGSVFLPQMLTLFRHVIDTIHAIESLNNVIRKLVKRRKLLLPTKILLRILKCNTRKGLPCWSVEFVDQLGKMVGRDLSFNMVDRPKKG